MCDQCEFQWYADRALDVVHALPEFQTRKIEMLEDIADKVVAFAHITPRQRELVEQMERNAGVDPAPAAFRQPAQSRSPALQGRDNGARKPAPGRTVKEQAINRAAQYAAEVQPPAQTAVAPPKTNAVLVSASYVDRDRGELQRVADALQLVSAAPIVAWHEAVENEWTVMYDGDWDAIRRALAAQYAGLCVVETLTGSVGLGVWKFANAFQQAGRPVLVLRDGAPQLIETFGLIAGGNPKFDYARAMTPRQAGDIPF